MRTFLLKRRTLLAAAVAGGVPAASRAQQQQTRHVDLLIDWKPGPTYAGFYIARENGGFRQRGLDVRIVEGHGANVSAAMIGAGKEYWIGSSSASATAIGRSHELPIRSLAVYYRRPPTVLYSRAEDRIDAPRDLIGKRVGLVAGSTTVEEYRTMLAANRIDRNRIKELEVDWGPQALLDRKVDALLDYEELAPAELQSQGKRITVMRLADFGLRTYSLNLIVNEMAYLTQARQQTARQIAEAVREGYQFVRDKPAEAAAIFGKLFPDFTPRYLELAMQIVARQLAPPIGSQTRLGWEDTLKILSGQRLLNRAVAAEEVAIYD
ncbi:MAG: ABC transporter substrate-binding protein [Proteobacteria bacterium]|nr:ABC transporter substrate-binding protein [Pseudomonadota bacterium]